MFKANLAAFLVLDRPEAGISGINDARVGLFKLFYFWKIKSNLNQWNKFWNQAKKSIWKL